MKEMTLESQEFILTKVPSNLSPLSKAYEYVCMSEKDGFKWKDARTAELKVKEEILEVEDAQNSVEECYDNTKLLEAKLHLEEEVGDLLFAIVSWSHNLGVNPCIAMDKANKKFYKRFSYVEIKMKDNGIPLNEEHCDDMEQFWKEAKKSK